MVILKDVAKNYFGQGPVFEKVTVELRQGEFLYVVGGSGTGKSTLLRILATQEAPTHGSVSLFGYSLATVNPQALRAIRQSLGYVPQNVRLIPDLTVEENITLSLSLVRGKSLSSDMHFKLNELLQRLGLDRKRDRLANTLSGGEAQRVAVARALIRAPELIVADEPTGSQDRDYTWILMDLFMKANAAGSTVVLATHDREIVRRVRKKCAVLGNGKISFEEVLCTY